MIPRISIITLTYNRPEFLAKAIESVAGQTHQDYEHLVLDNGSTDPRVQDVLRDAKKQRPDKLFYGRVEVMTDIVGRHWNTLLGFCRGKYISILDDDNYKCLEFIDATTQPLDTDDKIDAVTCGWLPVGALGEHLGQAIHTNLDTSIPRLFLDNTIDSNAITFRKKVLDEIGMFDPHLTTNEDWHFMIRLVRHCNVVHLQDVLLGYRVHETSRSKRAVELGAHANWQRIRSELFTAEEIKKARSLSKGV